MCVIYVALYGGGTWRCKATSIEDCVAHNIPWRIPWPYLTLLTRHLPALTSETTQTALLARWRLSGRARASYARRAGFESRCRRYRAHRFSSCVLAASSPGAVLFSGAKRREALLPCLAPRVSWCLRGFPFSPLQRVSTRPRAPLTSRSSRRRTSESCRSNGVAPTQRRG